MTPERVGGVGTGVAALVGQDEVADLAAGGTEREEQAEGVEAQARPDLDDTGEAADREDHAERGRARHGPPLHEPHPAEHERGREVLDEQRDADGYAGYRGEVAGLDAGHGEQAEPGEQRGTAAQQRAVAYGDRQHHQGRAGHPQPHHVERVEPRLDQRLGRDSGSAEGERGHEREAEPDALAAAGPDCSQTCAPAHDDRR